MKFELEFIDIRENKLVIHYSLEERWQNITSIEAEPTDSSIKLFEIIQSKLNKNFVFDKKSLRLLIKERQVGECDCFYYDDKTNSTKYYSPMFTKAEGVFVKLLKKYCTNKIKTHLK